MKKIRKISALIVSVCFFVNTLVYDHAMGISPVSADTRGKLAVNSIFSPLQGTQLKDRGNIRLTFQAYLKGAAGGRTSFKMKELKRYIAKYQKDIFGDTHFFVHESPEMADHLKLPENYKCVMVRTNKDNPGDIRTYYIVFSQNEEGDTGFFTEVFTRDELGNFSESRGESVRMVSTINYYWRKSAQFLEKPFEPKIQSKLKEILKLCNDLIMRNPENIYKVAPQYAFSLLYVNQDYSKTRTFCEAYFRHLTEDNKAPNGSRITRYMLMYYFFARLLETGSMDNTSRIKEAMLGVWSKELFGDLTGRNRADIILEGNWAELNETMISSSRAIFMECARRKDFEESFRVADNVLAYLRHCRGLLPEKDNPYDVVIKHIEKSRREVRSEQKSRMEDSLLLLVNSKSGGRVKKVSEGIEPVKKVPGKRIEDLPQGARLVFGWLKGTQAKDIGRIELVMEEYFAQYRENRLAEFNLSDLNSAAELFNNGRNGTRPANSVYEDAQHIFSDPVTLGNKYRAIRCDLEVRKKKVPFHQVNEYNADYYVVFPVDPVKKSALFAEVYTPKEWLKAEKFFEKYDILPRRNEIRPNEYAKIARYKENEKSGSVDQWIREKMEAGEYAVLRRLSTERVFQNANYVYEEDSRSDDIDDVLRFLKKLNINAETFDLLRENVQRKNIVLVNTARGEIPPALSHSSDYNVYIMLDLGMPEKEKNAVIVERLIYELGEHCGLKAVTDGVDNGAQNVLSLEYKKYVKNKTDYKFLSGIPELSPVFFLRNNPRNPESALDKQPSNDLADEIATLFEEEKHLFTYPFSGRSQDVLKRIYDRYNVLISREAHELLGERILEYFNSLLFYARDFKKVISILERQSEGLNEDKLNPADCTLLTGRAVLKVYFIARMLDSESVKKLLNAKFGFYIHWTDKLFGRWEGKHILKKVFGINNVMSKEGTKDIDHTVIGFVNLFIGFYRVNGEFDKAIQTIDNIIACFRGNKIMFLKNDAERRYAIERYQQLKETISGEKEAGKSVLERSCLEEPVPAAGDKIVAPGDVLKQSGTSLKGSLVPETRPGKEDNIFGTLKGIQPKEMGKIELVMLRYLHKYANFKVPPIEIDLRGLMEEATQFRNSSSIYENTRLWFDADGIEFFPNGYIKLKCGIKTSATDILKASWSVKTTYYAVFSVVKAEDSRPIVEIFTEGEWEKVSKVIMKGKPLPRRRDYSPEGFLAIRRYRKHETANSIDRWIKKKMKNAEYEVSLNFEDNTNVFKNVEDAGIFDDGDYIKDVLKRLTKIGIEKKYVESFKRILSEKPIILLNRHEGESLPEMVMLKKDGKTEVVGRVDAHSSDNAIYIIVDENLQGKEREKFIKDKLFYEASVHFGLSGKVDDDENSELQNKMTLAYQSPDDHALSETIKTRKPEAFVSKLSLVRDYASGMALFSPEKNLENFSGMVAKFVYDKYAKKNGMSVSTNMDTFRLIQEVLSVYHNCLENGADLYSSNGRSLPVPYALEKSVRRMTDKNNYSYLTDADLSTLIKVFCGEVIFMLSNLSVRNPSPLRSFVKASGNNGKMLASINAMVSEMYGKDPIYTVNNNGAITVEYSFKKLILHKLGELLNEARREGSRRDRIVKNLRETHSGPEQPMFPSLDKNTLRFKKMAMYKLKFRETFKRLNVCKEIHFTKDVDKILSAFEEQELFDGRNTIIEHVGRHIFKISLPEKNFPDGIEYQILFSTAIEGGAYPVVICTDAEIEILLKDILEQDRIPTRSKTDNRAIRRYIQHEEGIDTVLKYVHEERTDLLSSAEDTDFDYSKEVLNIMTSLNIRTENPYGLVPLRDRKCYFVKLAPEVYDMMNELPKARMIDITGREHEIIYSAHSSNNAVHLFLKPEFYNAVVRGDPGEGSGAKKRIREMLAHEIGVMLGLPFKPRTNGKRKGGVNEISQRWREFVSGRSREFIQLQTTIVDLDKNLLSRDYAAAEEDTSSIPRVRSLMKAAEAIGIEVAPPASNYTLFAACGLYKGREFGEDEDEYGSRFNLKLLRATRPDAIARVVSKAIKDEGLDPKNIIVQLSGTIASAEGISQIKDLAKKGVKFLVINTDGINCIDKDVRRKYRRNIYAIMLLARRIASDTAEDPHLYVLLRFFVCIHMAKASTENEIDSYLDALTENNIDLIARTMLSWLPIDKMRTPSPGIVSATLISA